MRVGQHNEHDCPIPHSAKLFIIPPAIHNFNMGSIKTHKYLRRRTGEEKLKAPAVEIKYWYWSCNIKYDGLYRQVPNLNMETDFVLIKSVQGCSVRSIRDLQRRVQCRSGPVVVDVAAVAAALWLCAFGLAGGGGFVFRVGVTYCRRAATIFESTRSPQLLVVSLLLPFRLARRASLIDWTTQSKS